ncbi:MAG: LPXTG cell wall anchor domain-containing protein [Nanoarchaeota archaeon]|nr:LPXTG cell wall anchor domain-containing protein [Nanoarchaeota archaeon]MBU1445539.1 LPXTG cell wall anchor domain-containing protein [Nanoarchaeota archaeon]MBU2406899.1 LPXTG cell wall anchor domain-containing protein [Nanoarchaeota archaeon]MBU2420638.1 LPXTG cell wall anchor domain-containing protein [Nanoarchaeota archaeon]MBU2474914.1 LPXTG cell wall anchor domain-containing protein [Nanoarchaeota archaeon]
MKAKRHLTSIMLTFFVISILLFLGPAEAIGVNIGDLDNIDFSDYSTEDFEIVVTVNDGEFLPIDYTNLMFNDGENYFSCKINSDNTNDCSFLTVNSVEISNLNGGYGYGYGYGSVGNPDYQDFGYGYGYGSDSGPGTITYSLTIDASKLPGFFVEKTVNVKATVFGEPSNGYVYFEGSTTFDFTSYEKSFSVVSGTPASIDYSSAILDIPNVPGGVTSITGQLVQPTVSPEVGNVKLVGKTFDFGADGTIFDPAITITLPYTREELLVANADENNLYVSYHDGSSWIEIPTIVDTVANTLTFEITHFTEFAVLEGRNVNDEQLCLNTNGIWMGANTPTDHAHCECPDLTVWNGNVGCGECNQDSDCDIENDEVCLIPTGECVIAPITLCENTNGVWEGNRCVCPPTGAWSDWSNIDGCAEVLPAAVTTGGGSSRFTSGGRINDTKEPLVEEEALVEEETEEVIEEITAQEATPDTGFEGITGAAIMDGLFGTNTSTALTVVGLIVILGLLFYFVFYRKKRIKKKN